MGKGGDVSEDEENDISPHISSFGRKVKIVDEMEQKGNKNS